MRLYYRAMKTWRLWRTWKLWSRYGAINFLPVILVILFVLQTVIFNGWVNLSSNPDTFLLLSASIALGVLIYGPAILLGARARYVYLLVAATLISLIFISQYLYFTLYGGFLQASAFGYAPQLNAEWGTIFRLLTPGISAFVLSIVAVLIALVLRIKATSAAVTLHTKEKIIAAMVLIVIVCAGYGTLLVAGGDVWTQLIHPAVTFRDIDSFTYSPDQTVQEVGICNYFLGDIIGTLLRTTPVTQTDLTFVQSQLSGNPPLTKGPYFGAASGDNLIFVQVESLESAVIGQSIGGQEITPTLDELAKEGLYFDNYYTQIGPGNTADAEFVTLNSLYPLTNTVAFIDFANNTYNALPALLVQSGYHSYALHGDVPDFWNRANIYPALGYQVQISKDDFIPTETGFSTLDDDDFLAQSAQKMSGFQQPFMATVITLSSHTPFIIPEQYQSLQFPSDSTLSDRQKDYLQSIHYTDAALGAFIVDLKAEGIYSHSLIAIYGDHGSSTGISAALGDDTMPPALDNSQVPLILLNPHLNVKLHGTISTPGSHLDLYPTVANLLGIKPTGIIFGQDLLSTKTPVITHRDPYSAIITTILTAQLEYDAADSGIFADGTCKNLPASTTLPIGKCQTLYDEQAANIKASDFIVRGNLIPSLSQAQ
jgi:lipoteichoic acid synthase